jgi:hypothetical protein
MSREKLDARFFWIWLLVYIVVCLCMANVAHCQQTEFSHVKKNGVEYLVPNWPLLLPNAGGCSPSPDNNLDVLFDDHGACGVDDLFFYDPGGNSLTVGDDSAGKYVSIQPKDSLVPGIVLEDKTTGLITRTQLFDDGTFDFHHTFGTLSHEFENRADRTSDGEATFFSSNSSGPARGVAITAHGTTQGIGFDLNVAATNSNGFLEGGDMTSEAGELDFLKLTKTSGSTSGVEIFIDASTTNQPRPESYIFKAAPNGNATKSVAFLSMDSGAAVPNGVFGFFQRTTVSGEKNHFDSTTEFANGAQVVSTTFASLPTCNAGARGTLAWITDSNTNVWGANAAAGGANSVGVSCNGTAWTVFAK